MRSRDTNPCCDGDFGLDNDSVNIESLLDEDCAAALEGLEEVHLSFASPHVSRAIERAVMNLSVSIADICSQGRTTQLQLRAALRKDGAVEVLVMFVLKDVVNVTKSRDYLDESDPLEVDEAESRDSLEEPTERLQDIFDKNLELRKHLRTALRDLENLRVHGTYEKSESSTTVHV